MQDKKDEDNVIRLSEEADLISICAAQNAASVVPRRTSPSIEEVENRYDEFLTLMEEFADVLELLRDGVTPTIDSVFSYTESQDAFARLESGEQFGKIVIDWSSLH